jgi:hypothetical protein
MFTFAGFAKNAAATFGSSGNASAGPPAKIGLLVNVELMRSLSIGWIGS